MNPQDHDFFCPYCGAKNYTTQQYCANCGSLIQEPKQISQNIASFPPISPKEPLITSENRKSSLFDIIHPYILIDWAFSGTKDAMIYNKMGQEWGRITRKLSDFGIEYSLLDPSTQESVIIQQYDSTHYRLISKEGKELAVIESRKVKETIEIHPSKSSSVAYFTELEEFARKKTIYGEDEEHEAAEIHRTRVEEIPEDLKIANSYTLSVKKTDINFRLVLGLAIICLMMFKSNPYH
jgi:hypothetical protein